MRYLDREDIEQITPPDAAALMALSRLFAEAVNASGSAMAQLTEAFRLVVISPKQARFDAALARFSITNPDGSSFCGGAQYLLTHYPGAVGMYPRALLAWRLLERGWLWRPARWVARWLPLRVVYWLIRQRISDSTF